MVALQPATTNAQGTEDNKKTTEQKDAKPAESYTYTAQSGDSYSLIARKAIQTYGIQNKVKLSQAQIIAAETKLTQAAGSPVLVVGQKVSIKKSDVKTQVEAVQKLSAAEQAEWQYYVQFADFNTDAVGEAS